MRLLLISLFLVSCTPLREPCIQLPQNYREVSENREASNESPNLVAFWEDFNDPLLNQLVEKAIHCNLDLQAAKERILEARAILGIETAPLFPQIEASLFYDRTRNSATLDNSPFLGGRFTKVYQIGIDAFWEIDLFGKNLNRRQKALFEALATSESTLTLNLTIITEVIRTYMTIRAIQEQIQVATNHIKSETMLVDLTRDRYESGYASKLNFYSSEALLQSRKGNIPGFQAELKDAIYSMAVLIGDLPENLTHVFDCPQPLPKVMAHLQAGLPTYLLSCRPDIQEKELLMYAAGAEVKYSKKKLLPTLSLSGFYSFAAGFYRKLFNLDSRAAEFLPQLSLPLFQGGGLISEVIAATARQRAAVYEYEQSILIALKETETSLISHLLETQRLELLTLESENYRLARELATERFIAGLEDFLYVIDIERDYFIAQNLVILSKLESILFLVGFYKALGGGIRCIALP